MHPRILAQRTGIASEKLVLAARRLAQAIDLPEDLVNALMPATNNSQIKPMLVLEACANLVEAAANRLEAAESEIAIAASIEPTGDGGVAILLEPQAEPTQEPAPDPKPAYLNRKAKKA